MATAAQTPHKIQTDGVVEMVLKMSKPLSLTKKRRFVCAVGETDYYGLKLNKWVIIQLSEVARQVLLFFTFP